MAVDFDVFISYRRSDGTRAARAIRRLLQDYRPPRALRARFARRLNVYLDRIYESGTNDFFEGTILPALLASRSLLIVLTPAAADRGDQHADWMRREFEAFEGGPRAGHVIVVLAEGSFDDPRPSALMRRYPNVEIIDMRGLGPFAFLQPTKAARLSDETVKLVAPLFEIGPEDMPALRREAERRQQVRLGLAAGALSAIIVAATGLSIVTLQSRNRAIDALSRSLYAADRVIQSAAESMREGEQRSRLLITSCDLLDSLRSEAGRDPSSGSLVDCAQERAAARDGLGEHAQAANVIDAVTKTVRARFGSSGLADDGAALVDIDLTALNRAIGQRNPLNPTLVLDKIVAEAIRVAKALPDETGLGKRAADAFRTVAVSFVRGNDAASGLKALDGAITLREVAIADAPSTADANRVEEAADLVLKGRLSAARGDDVAGNAALSRARALIAAIQPAALKNQALAARFDTVGRMLGPAETKTTKATRP